MKIIVITNSVFVLMQLFITEYSKNDHIAITAPRVVHQVYKVLRMQSGDRFAVQKESATERLVVQLDTITPTTITASISQTIERPSLSDTTLIIAYPNKFEKIELIIQKLSEIGISDIIFRDGERSQLHTLSEHKIARCHTIALEAVEQSHGRVLPRISQISHLSDAHIHPQEAVVCDHHDTIDQTVLYKRSQCIV